MNKLHPAGGHRTLGSSASLGEANQYAQLAARPRYWFRLPDRQLGAAGALLARRLPPGILRDLAAFIPDCVTAIRRLRNNPDVPRRAKIAIIIASIWVASPIDLIPEFLPVIGPLDDIVVVAIALRYAGRQVPRQTLLDAWPGDPRLLKRLLGPAKPGPGGEG